MSAKLFPKIKKSTLCSSIQAPPGLAALPVVRAPLVALQDQGDRVVQVPRRTGRQDKGRSSNNKPRHRLPGLGNLVPSQPPALNSSLQPRDKAWVWAWAWGKARPSQGRWDRQVDPWGKLGRQDQQEPHHLPW